MAFPDPHCWARQVWPDATAHLSWALIGDLGRQHSQHWCYVRAVCLVLGLKLTCVLACHPALNMMLMACLLVAAAGMVTR